MDAVQKLYIRDQVTVITGGAGLLGKKHAEAVLEGGGIAVLLDLDRDRLESVVQELNKQYGQSCADGFAADITDKDALMKVRGALMEKYGRIDALINNAANNPKVEDKKMTGNSFEEFSLDLWDKDLLVGLTGAFLCSQVFGKTMAERKKGVILNISSDLGIIAPDQRIYRRRGVPEAEQVKKPVTYSVVKHGLIGLTKYLATYWADSGVRVNTLCPAGVRNNQDQEFVDRLTNLIPMGRMAEPDEYKSAVLFMLSDASAYMTGSTLIMDGGRTCW